MSGSEHEQVQSNRSTRRLNFSAMLLHNDHLQSGRRKVNSCGVCRTGLESVLETVPQEIPRDEKVGDSKGDGANEEGDAPLPSDRRDSGWPG